MDYYNSKGNTVYTATFDISKAFDMINHYKLFDSLIKAGISGWIIDLFVNWYSKLTVIVRWITLLQLIVLKDGEFHPKVDRRFATW